MNINSTYFDYDMVANEYETKYLSDACLSENEEIGSHLLSLYNDLENKRVIDLGVGAGLSLSIAQERIKQQNFIGIDVSTELLKICANKYPDCRLINDDAENTLRKLVSEEHEADIIFSAFAIPYIRVGAIEQAFNVLKKGGLFIAVYYNAATPTHNKASVYHRQENHFFKDVFPQVGNIINRTEELFKTEYRTTLKSRAYDLAIFEKPA
jgi:ubiquinone/menaquinone biosynthesis C-methylase UbiE